MNTEHTLWPLYQRTVIALALLVALATCGQEKKYLSENDYGLWCQLRLHAASGDAQWVAYTLHYQNGGDTLRVQNTGGRASLDYPGADAVRFGGGYAAIKNSNGSLHLRQLKNSRETVYPQVDSFDFTGDGSCLFMLQNGELVITALATNTRYRIPGVTTFSYSATANTLAYIGTGTEGQRLALFHLGSWKIREVATGTDARYQNLTWAKSGKQLAFECYSDADGAAATGVKIGLYDLDKAQLSVFNPQEHPDFPKDKGIACTYLKPLMISDDGSRVFFGIAGHSSPSQEDAVVQIWNTADVFIYPNKQEINGWASVAKVAVWWPRTGRFFTPAHNYPSALLTGDQQRLLTYDPGQYEPQYQYFAPVDIELTTLETGEKKKVLEKWPFSPGQLQVSPCGGLILYWKDAHWWVYDILKDAHRNLTADLHGTFYDSSYDRPSAFPPFGVAGWSSDDRYLFLYDRYDIWKIATDGSTSRRITSGAATATQYRLVVEQTGKGNLDGRLPVQINVNTPVLIKGTTPFSSALWVWQKGKPLKKVTEETGKITEIHADTTGKKYVYVMENYQCPPTIRYSDQKGNTKSVYKSNPQQQHYYWGKAKMITYRDSLGTSLNGILYYPANYNPVKYYPMVVHLYEKQSGGISDYINPSLYNPTGFNISNLLAKGYFVLLPDIHYRVGMPGQSALDCTKAAVQKAMETAPIDPARLGLVGHSWGGYETAYSITRTSLFKTAVAGAAITDLTANYFTVAWNNYIPNYYQSEYDQVRLGMGFYDDPTRYIKNAPLYNAARITTPLLSWAGEQDKQVATSQTIALHMALRRLGKKNIMLLYPGERHVLLDKKHQQDLTHRLEEWLGYYLKGEPESGWCRENVLK